MKAKFIIGVGRICVGALRNTQQIWKPHCDRQLKPERKMKTDVQV